MKLRKTLMASCSSPNQLGKFGRSEDATLWLGFTENPELSALAAHIRESLYDYGIVYDHKLPCPRNDSATRQAAKRSRSLRSRSQIPHELGG